MANTILIKSKTDGAGAPAHGAGLKVAELAVNTSNTPATAAGRGNLFLGVTAESATNLTAGTNTASAYNADQTGGIVWVGAPILDEDDMASNDATKLATQQSIKAYIDTATAATRDIDALDAFSGVPHATNDEFLISDNGTEKRATTTMVANGAFALVSGDATIAAGGALTIAADSVEHSMVNDNLISGFTNIGEAPASSDELLVSDGGTLKAMTIANLAASSEFASAVSVSDNSGSTAMPVVFHDESNNLHDDTGAFTYKPSTGEVTATKFIGALTGNVTGDASGSAGTVTSIGNLTGDVTSSNRATTIAAAAVHHGMLHDDIISGQDALTSGLASTDEFAISDAGTVKRMDVSVLQSYLQSNLTFTTNTDTDVSIANLKTRLAGGFGSNAVTIGDSSDVVTIGNDLIVTGDLTISGDTVTANVATLDVEDKNITVNKGSGDTSSTADGAGLTIQDAVDASNDATLLWNASNDKFVFSHLIEAPGTSIFTNLDISGDVDVDGALETDALTIGGTAIASVIAGTTVANATTAAVATTVTITDNESTDEDNAIIFTAGGDVDGGNIGLESDGTCTYNPSTGKITATGFVGALTGNVTGDVTGDVTGNADTSTKIASITNSNIVQLTSSQTLTNKVLTSPDINTPDIDGGNIDGATIATSDITVGSSKTLNVSGGTLTTSTAQKKAIVEGVGSSFDVGNVTMTANGITIDGTFTDGTMSIVGGAISSATIDAGSYTAA